MVTLPLNVRRVLEAIGPAEYDGNVVRTSWPDDDKKTVHPIELVFDQDESVLTLKRPKKDRDPPDTLYTALHLASKANGVRFDAEGIILAQVGNRIASYEREVERHHDFARRHNEWFWSHLEEVAIRRLTYARLSKGFKVPGTISGEYFGTMLKPMSHSDLPEETVEAHLPPKTKSRRYPGLEDIYFTVPGLEGRVTEWEDVRGPLVNRLWGPDGSARKSDRVFGNPGLDLYVITREFVIGQLCNPAQILIRQELFEAGGITLLNAHNPKGGGRVDFATHMIEYA